MAQSTRPAELVQLGEIAWLTVRQWRGSLSSSLTSRKHGAPLTEQKRRRPGGNWLLARALSPAAGSVALRQPPCSRACAGPRVGKRGPAKLVPGSSVGEPKSTAESMVLQPACSSQDVLKPEPDSGPRDAKHRSVVDEVPLTPETVRLRPLRQRGQARPAPGLGEPAASGERCEGRSWRTRGPAGGRPLALDMDGERSVHLVGSVAGVERVLLPGASGLSS
jgi:hypothetical protein